MSVMNSILIIAEHVAGKLKPSALELAAAARLLKKKSSDDTVAVLLGVEVEKPATEMSQKAGLEVIGLQAKGLANYNSEIYKTLLLELIEELKPEYILGAHSSQGLDFLPALAVKTGAACITGVEKIDQHDGSAVFIRSICGGKLKTTMKPDSGNTILTIQPGSFEIHDETATVPGKVSIRHRQIESKAVQNRGLKPGQTENSALREAKVIVAGGRGLGDEENLALLEKLATLFDRSTVGGSRPICDLGWLQYNRQIGITGATVAPDLYIACGISGTSQHVMGMKGSGFIVSINRDPNAAIFNTSDVCVVEDLVSFIPLLLEEYRKRKED